MNRKLIIHLFIFGLVILLIGMSFLPVIDSKIINEVEKYKNDNQQIFKITFKESSEIVTVEKKNSNIDIGELYRSFKALNLFSGNKISAGIIFI